jgi:hypothetical protein
MCQTPPSFQSDFSYLNQLLSSGKTEHRGAAIPRLFRFMPCRRRLRVTSGLGQNAKYSETAFIAEFSSHGLAGVFLFWPVNSGQYPKRHSRAQAPSAEHWARSEAAPLQMQLERSLVSV